MAYPESYSWQDTQWKSSVNLVEKGCLPHALLLHGNSGVGKADFAHALSRRVLCNNPAEGGVACGQCRSCQLVEAETHPDLTLIEPIPPEKSRSKKPVLNIRIDTIRSLCSKLSGTSLLGGYRVVIIQNAEKMLVQAANALLKTLEEPGLDTLILLVSSRPHQLPVTLRSRCQSLRFVEPDRPEAITWLEAKGIENAPRWLNYAHGAPLLAIQYAEQQTQPRQLLADALFATSSGKLSLSYANKLADLPRELTLAWLLDWIGDVIKLKHSEHEIPLINEDFREKLLARVTGSSSRQVFAYYDQVCRYIEKDGIALNSQLLWENLLLSWDNL